FSGWGVGFVHGSSTGCDRRHTAYAAPAAATVIPTTSNPRPDFFFFLACFLSCFSASLAQLRAAFCNLRPDFLSPVTRVIVSLTNCGRSASLRALALPAATGANWPAAAGISSSCTLCWKFDAASPTLFAASDKAFDAASTTGAARSAEACHTCSAPARTCSAASETVSPSDGALDLERPNIFTSLIGNDYPLGYAVEPLVATICPSPISFL